MERFTEYEELWREQTGIKAEKMATLVMAQVATAGDFFEWCVDRYTNNVAVTTVDTFPSVSFTYAELDSMANKVANWSLEHGMVAGDCVALFLENKPEYLYITMGFAKIGVTIALLNINLKAQQLFQAIQVAKPKIMIASTSLKHAWDSATQYFSNENILPPCIWWYGQFDDEETNQKVDMKKRKTEDRRDFEESIITYSNTRPEKKTRLSVRPRDPLFYIYTSGTTGVSKAAKFSHLRFIGCALTWSGPCKLTQNDRYYVSLPLYHGNAGCVAVAPCYYVGATIVLRTKFSVSHFWSDIKSFECTAMIYIGELWRYLEVNALNHDKKEIEKNQKEKEKEKEKENQSEESEPTNQKEDKFRDHKLRVIVGNGLRTETWKYIVERFNIPNVVEHYGSTEMPGDAVLNYFNVPGSCGYVPPSVWKEKDTKIIKYDVEKETIVRNEEGFCIECEPDEVGEIIFKLPEGKYDGYVGKEETEKKLYGDVFQTGDTWWSSGDLLKIDQDGFFYFVDRIGDTFRWKGENVSTNEVCQVLQKYDGISEANVYGVFVHGHPGKAGMASITIKSKFDGKELFKYVKESLPSYSIPLFLRATTKENDKTATLKFQKYKYAKEGFDPAIIQDSLFFFNSEVQEYVCLNLQVYKDIRDGKYKF